MTKSDVLTAFAQANGFLSPDELRIRIRWRLDRRSVYSYLLRLARQGFPPVMKSNKDATVIHIVDLAGSIIIRMVGNATRPAKTS